MTNPSGLTQTSPALLAISEQKRSGLILCKSHHADFAGPGAVVGCNVEAAYTAIIAIGAPTLVPVVTHEERQRAYSRRIQWLRWLQKITDHTDPLQRAEKLFSSFEAFFGGQVLLNLPDEVLALLAGVLPPTIALARSQYFPLGRDDLRLNQEPQMVCQLLYPTLTDTPAPNLLPDREPVPASSSSPLSADLFRWATSLPFSA